jgi:hypothetical protein
VRYSHSCTGSISAWKKKTDVAGVLVEGRRADGCTIGSMCQQICNSGWSAVKYMMLIQLGTESKCAPCGLLRSHVSFVMSQR